jgi:PAS domain S-box-containing protein
MNRSASKQSIPRVAPASPTIAERRLRAEVVNLRERLLTADETMRAIRAGEVDALVMRGPAGDQIFTLTGAESSYRLLVETMSEGAATFREDGTILYCNSRFAAMVGQPLERVMGARIDDLIAPQDVQTFRALVRHGLEREAKADVVFGSAQVRPVPAYISLSPLLADDGSALICLVATDLSARKRSEDMLASERLATSVIEQATDAMMVCDVDQRIIRASKGVIALSLNSPLFLRFPDAFPSERLQSMVTAALLGRRSHGVAACFDAGNGKPLEVLASAAPLLGTKGDIVGAIVTLTDVSDLKRTQRELEVAVRVREEFLMIASHELRTPLTSLLLQLGALRAMVEREVDPTVDSRCGKGVRAAYRQAQRLAKLTDTLLDVSRLSGHIRLELEEFDLTGAAREIVERWSEEADIVGCELRFHENGPSVGLWDSLRIEQALVNLLSNATKYGPGKPIDITIETTPDSLCLTVEDRGMGIGAEDAERIFQLFERAVSSKHYGGLGLGLFITRQIVEACGGTIEVASQVGQGSVFRMWLPVRKQVPPAEENATPGPRPVSG